MWILTEIRKFFYLTPADVCPKLTVEQIAEMMKPDPNYVPDPDLVAFADRIRDILDEEERRNQPCCTAPIN